MVGESTEAVSEDHILSKLVFYGEIILFIHSSMHCRWGAVWIGFMLNHFQWLVVIPYYDVHVVYVGRASSIQSTLTDTPS